MTRLPLRKMTACLAVATAAIASTAQADVVHLDDVIVDGSLCAGMDCVNGENFGFDTFRVKENNLRIHFQDTSNSGSFPTNDWRLIANDSANGGANYFGIEDSDAGRIPFRVEAGAPANSLYVEDGGRIGLGTSTPVVELHVVDGDSPTLRLEQNGSSGFTPQTWDVAGNEANFFVRDVTNGSKLPFRIYPGAATSTLVVASNGNVGIGTTSPDDAADLHISRAGDAIIQLSDTSSEIDWQFKNQGGLFKVTTPPGGALEQEMTLDADGNLTLSGYLSIRNGVTAPSTVSSQVMLYVDTADGDLKVLFPNGTVTTLATN